MERFSEYNWRGPRPKDLRDLQNLGFERVISLQSGAENWFTNSLYETQTRYALKPIVPYVNIHSSDIFPPTRRHVKTCISMLIEPKKTYLHCHSGVDRTGFMVAVYRQWIEGWAFVDAHKEWVDKGRHFWYFWWKKELKKYEHHT